jgi:tRNA (guanine37-N1)-methyltransferase
MRFDLITLFPDMTRAFVEQGVTGRAIQRGIAELVCWNPRDYTNDAHRTVDDRPYGGGPGMLMKPEPLQQAILAASKASSEAPVIYLSPQGMPFNQVAAKRLSQRKGFIFLAGRYEGIDERIIDTYVDEEWSIGDYVLSGGELAALVIMDALIRLLPGTLGDQNSAQQDSHMEGLLDCPHYTRPEVFAGMAVPEVLLSGNHEAIRRWRLTQSLQRTRARRPDLLAKKTLTTEEQYLLSE